MMPSTSGTGSSSSAAEAARLSAEFARLTGTLQVRSAGLVFAPVGGPTTALGTWTSGPAWSTVKVPLSLAARNRAGSAAVDALIHRALTRSDNDAATDLWSRLGAGRSAAAAVDEVLAAHGDGATRTQPDQVRPPYSPFGQTVWSLTGQVTFASALACSAADAPVLEEMTQVISSQRWGLGRLPSPAFKGGWGPDTRGRYLVRQFGVVTLDGHLVAVALAAEPTSGSFDDGVRAATLISDWLERTVHPTTGGCP
ncbi:MAG: hypothetical protein P8Z68_10950 [Kineosporiaceae bacterium]